MASNGLPTGWSYEGPDESVGIFGEAFVHEDCKLPDVEDADTDDQGDTLVLTCKCGATVTLEQPEPDYPPDDWDRDPRDYV